MDLLVLSREEVSRLLPMDECIEVMKGTFEALTRGDVILPSRPTMWLREKRGALVMMPSSQEDLQGMGLKVISYFPGNQGGDYDTIQGAVLLFESQNGRLLAVIDAASTTAIRTAAVSGLATRLLANEGAHDLAILGSGTQARTHLEAMLAVRPVESVAVWSRNLDHARRFADQEGERHGIAIAAAATAEEAVRGADLICTTTSSKEPILHGGWVAPGAHINAVGSSVPFARELDTEAVVRSSLFADRIEAILAEAGDFLLAKEEGAVQDDHILAEIGDLLSGEHPGRTDADQITLFESVGLAVEDLAAAHHVYRKASERGAGVKVNLG